METLSIQKKDALTAFQKADESGKKLLTNLFGNQLPINITDRIKTFEDACAVLELNPDSILPYPKHTKDPEEISINAYRKLITIARALNEGWKPDWKNSNESKYYCWFFMNSGSGLSVPHFVRTRSITYVGSRLCFKTSDLAIYAANQFSDIYTEYFIM